MPDYLLPCSCGERTVVSTAQAGGTVRCSCGKELAVPAMRGLRELDEVTQSASRTGRATTTWEDRHRVAFLLALGALTCLGVGIYLWATLPALIDLPTSEQLDIAVDEAAPQELFLVHADLLSNRLGNSQVADFVGESRRIKMWGILVVLVLAVAALASAAFVLFNGRRSPDTKPRR